MQDDAALMGPEAVAVGKFFRKIGEDVGEDLAKNGRLGQAVSVWPGAACDAMRLDAPVDFYIAEHAQSPLPLKAGQELWIEVTVPAKGPPRPMQLALKENGGWTPLAFQ
jgi:hypothetical protein